MAAAAYAGGMKLARTILATILFGTALPILAGTPEIAPGTSAHACTPDAQKCLEKLESRMVRPGGTGADLEHALLELHATDPECALLLRGAVRPAF